MTPTPILRCPVESEPTLAPDERERARNASVVVTVASRECFVVPLEDAQAPRVRGASLATLTFDLEPCLPLDAEAMAAGVVWRGRNPALAVACRREPVVGYVEAIQAVDGWIAAVVPDALLLTQACCESGLIPRSCRVVFSIDGIWNQVVLREGVPSAWSWLSDDELCKAARTSDALYVAAPSPPTWTFEASGLHLLDPSAVRESETELAARFVSGRSRPWLDLRSGGAPTAAPWRPLAGALTALATAIVVALAVFLGLLAWRTHELELRAHDEQTRQRAAFARLFPKQSPPVDVAGRLASEERRLRATVAELRTEAPVASSFPTLVHWLNHLPTDSDWRVDSLRASGAQIASLDGAAKSLADVERFTAQLRAAGYEFNPPALAQNRDGFSFHLERVRFKGLPTAKPEASP